jgi:anhydro-N-acetylmuramic acid kinase
MLTATSIAKGYQQFAPHPVEEVILGGGGRHNQTLVQLLETMLQIPVRSHEDIGLNSDFKEALVFALLAHETWHGRIAALPAQTGAAHATVLGQITPGRNYADLLRRTWCP